MALVVAISPGCHTTTRTRELTAAPPSPTVETARVAGIVLCNGTSVRFVEPVAASPDGSVTGAVEVPWPGTDPSRPGTAMRRVTYAPAEIASYEIESEERRFQPGKTLLLVAAVATGALVALWLHFVSVVSDPNF